MAEAGWTFDAGTPNTFARKGVTVVIAPPTSGRWSSSWTLPDGRTGRGVATLLKAVL
jgi:hypothetical protein